MKTVTSQKFPSDMKETNHPGHSDYLTGYARALATCREMLVDRLKSPEGSSLMIDDIDALRESAQHLAESMFIEIDWINPPMIKDVCDE